MNIYSPTGGIASPDWEYQVCKKCGHEQRLDYCIISDSIWNMVAGKKFKDRVLCLECFLQLADEKGIKLKRSDMCFVCVISKTGWGWEY